MNVFLRGTDCFEKSLNYIFFSSCLCILHVLKNEALQLKDQVQLMKIFNHQEGCC